MPYMNTYHALAASIYEDRYLMNTVTFASIFALYDKMCP